MQIGKKGQRTEHWTEQPAEHDFPAAASYLSLLVTEAVAASLVGDLRVAETSYGKAKDLMRASGLALLPADNAHVAQDLKKVARGEPLSPVLLVRGNAADGRPLIVADGYHRVCASYHLEENADIPFRIVDLARRP